MAEPTKRCSKCGIEKSLESCFYFDKRRGAHVASCRTCGNLMSRAWQKNNPAKDAAIHARYLKTAKGRVTAAKIMKNAIPKQMVWRTNNKERLCGYSAKFRSNLSPEGRENMKNVQLKYDLHKNYKMTVGEYEDRLAKQNGVCAICHQPPKTGGKKAAARLHVDHDHVTDRVRGLLCGSCNTGMGLLKDSAELLLSAARYLKEFNNGDSGITEGQRKDRESDERTCFWQTPLWLQQGAESEIKEAGFGDCIVRSKEVQ